MTAKFQKIQSAHEVLIDATERAKYDANRIRVSSSSFRSTYSGGQASGMRGNPWANAGSQWQPPPKPPTARNRPAPPPPSTGAGRYAKFTPPTASAYQSAQEGPQARKAQYEAWDRTRHQTQTEHGPGKTWKAPQPPPRGTPTSGREESNAQTHSRPPKSSQPGFDEFRESNSSHGRSQSTNAASRKGFMPNNPGGDEPPAPRGAYSTQRDKPSVAPDPPPRQRPPPVPESSRPSAARTDPLKKFRMNPPTMEERVSTPYATHGGEKFNPFESAAAAAMNRSKSTRERSEAFGKDNFPRTGSDTSLNNKNGTPHRARSFAERSSHAPRASFAESLDMDSSSDEPIEIPKPAARASARRSNGATPRVTKQAGTTDPETQTTSKQSRIQQMRQWMKENPGQEPPPNGFGADGPPLRSGQPTAKATGEPSMYAGPDPFTQSYRPTPTSFDKRRPSSYSVKLEALSQKIPSSAFRAATYPPTASVKYPDLSKNTTAPTPPSGVNASPNSLNAFEQMQRSHLDRLLSNKRQASLDDTYKTPDGEAPKTNAGSQTQESKNGIKPDNWTQYRDSTDPLSPSKKPKTLRHLQSNHSYDFQSRRTFWDHHLWTKSEANKGNTSFSFNVNDETFATKSPKANGFSNSAENISTKFTPEDWDGKFEAGASYFQPEKVPSTPQRPRSQSNSRSRGRSPIKVQPPFGMPSRPEEQTPIESPGGTKFSAQDWAETFKPQTFMPPPMQPRTGPGNRKRSLKPTMGGNAAVIDESDTSDEKPLFQGRNSQSPPKASPPVVGSPEPMDVDTPPFKNTVPQFPQTNGKLNTEQLKRPAASASASPVDSELKVAFEDLKVKDIISTLNMPTPPPTPAPPATDKDIPTRAAYDDYLHRYEKYMLEWDRFNAKFLLHMVARKNQNDELKEKRWADDKGLETYRMGLKEDQAVMHKWSEHTSVHETAVKCFVIMKERMQNGDVTAETRRPRKKTH